jgi:hypothetical protein
MGEVSVLNFAPQAFNIVAKSATVKALFVKGRVAREELTEKIKNRLLRLADLKSALLFDQVRMFP